MAAVHSILDFGDSDFLLKVSVLKACYSHHPLWLSKHRNHGEASDQNSCKQRRQTKRWARQPRIEEENQRLRKEREDWIAKALEISKRLAERQNGGESLHRLQDNESLGRAHGVSTYLQTLYERTREQVSPCDNACE